MINRDDVIRILPCVGIRWAKVDCRSCPYNERPGKIWENGCVIGQERLVKDAIELLKGNDEDADTDLHAVASETGQSKANRGTEDAVVDVDPSDHPGGANSETM